MKLEQMSARIAPRNAWQAIDLGVHAWRVWWRPLTTIWLATTLIPFCLLMWWGYPDNLIWAMLIFWWLKPAWERPLLAYCARALFDPDADTWSPVLSNRSALTRGLVPQLLWRRLDPSRSINMSVNQLEGLSGEKYSQRVRALGMGGSSHGGTLTIGLLHIEQGFAYALTILLMMLWPNQLDMESVEWFLDTHSPWFMASLCCWYVAMTVTQPLYVASGFTAYLNRRTWLEAWDLQLGLRRIGEQRKVHGGATMALLACLLLPAIWPSETLAETAPQQEAITILAGEDFSPMEIRHGWRLREMEEEPLSDEITEEEADWLMKFIRWLFDGEGAGAASDTPDWLRHLDSPAEILRLLLWCIVISILIWAIWRFRSLIKVWQPDASKTSTRPVSLAGLDIRRQNLPDDVVAAALAALADNKVRHALALLYRATLSRLVDRHRLALAPGSTESECLTAFREAIPDDQGVALLAQITPHWIATAWAHRPPEADAVKALALQWQSTFEAGEPA